jgi:hypothetical protein
LFFSLYSAITLRSQTAKDPVAKFSFNNQKDFDEVSHTKVKLVGANYTQDRFNNDKSAIYLSGNQNSYINLGNYAALKLKTASISLWLKIDNEIWAGSGYTVNPVILTKSCNKDDFFESYALYYCPEGDNISACTTKDSLNQMNIVSPQKFERFKWHHLVITYNNDHLAFYIDGKKVGEVTKGFETKFLAGDSVMVGATANKKNDRFLNGYIDDIAFYNRVLNQEEVRELYNAPNPNKNKVILNWVLFVLAFIILIVILYFFIKAKVKKTIKKEKERLELTNKILETELRVNRASMNPHFIFNSLNTLHNFILVNDIDNASDYLIKFSKLIRKILDSNMHESNSLELEIELLERYLEIENLRFEETINYLIVIDDAVVPSAINIPIMMLQPFVENAIWYGLLNKQGEKKLTITFSLYEDKYIYCVIEDNGTGRKKGVINSVEKKSLATAFIEQRLDLLNKIYGLKCSLYIEDKPNNQGTIVKIILPILPK